MLSNRQLQIIKLLEDSGEVLTADWISKKLNISIRTLRNDIRFIRKEAKAYGINLKSISGKGYKLEIISQELYNSKIYEKKTFQKALDFSDQEFRIYYLLRRFLLEKNYILLENLEKEMFVSKSTIKNDLKIVKKALASYDLSLENRPHYGLYVKGPEYKKRLCFSNYLLHKNNHVKKTTTDYIGKEFLYHIKSIIIKNIKNFNVTLSDISLENLATHIAIACIRLKEKFVIDEINLDLEKKHPFEAVVAKSIIKDIELDIGLKFPRSEIAYIILHLAGTKLLSKEEIFSYSNKDETKEIIDEILKSLKKELNWNFYHDNEFIHSLALHIRPAINRIKYGLNIHNPLLKEIKKAFPSAFEGAIIAVKCIEKKLGVKISEDEIGFIALHIGTALEREKIKTFKNVLIVCASGIGSAKLLSYRLKNNFSNYINIVDTISYYQLEDYNLSNIDFIISTIPITKTFDIPVLTVNTFLSESDIENISNYLVFGDLYDEQDFLDPSRIFLNIEFNDKESVIRFLCEELYKQNLVTKKYVHLVLEREKLAPTSYGNLVAIPHPITPSTDKTFWTVCTLKQPILWDEDHPVQFVCLLNVKKGAKKTLDFMYDRLIRIINSKSVIEKIIKCESKEELIDILYKF